MQQGEIVCVELTANFKVLYQLYATKLFLYILFVEIFAGTHFQAAFAHQE